MRATDTHMRNQPPHAASNVGRLDPEVTRSLFLMDHVCPACGHDCSTIRTPPDPIYGLAVVVCPGCGLASVRRLVWARWSRRNPPAVWRSILALVLRTLVLLVMTGLSVAAVAAGAETIEHAMRLSRGQDAVIDESFRLPVAISVAALVGLAMVSSVALAWIAPQRSRLSRALIPGVIVALLVWVLPNGVSAASWYFRSGMQYHANRTFHADPPPFSVELGRWSWGVALAALVALVWACGHPADRFARYVSQQSWLTRLAKARRRRHRSRS